MGGKASIILVMGFAMVLGFLTVNLNTFATKAIGNMTTYHESTVAHNLALAGANTALSKVYQDTTWTGPITQSYNSPLLRGSFTASVINLGAAGKLMRCISAYPASTGETLRDTIEVSFNARKKNSFSMFAWMTNFEGNVFWVTGDSVWGRVHSNGNLHVNGKPVFFEKATTSKGFDPKPGVGANKAIYKAGYETGVAEIQFPNDISEIVNASTTGGKKYTTDIWVTLSPGTASTGDGKVYIRTSSAGPIVDSIDLADASFNGALLSTGRVNVKGTLDGKLTIASMTDVYVQDDVIYEQNPITGPSDDLLGLVAESNVIVADNAANNSNCRIDACVFTRTGSFLAEHYNSRGLSGMLGVNGSIVQQTRGEVGQYAGSTLTSGFSKSYRYDPRLADPTFRPPYYPGFYVQTFGIGGWWESYRITRAD
jgi:hypothetical protein